jgi:hypothetical protein
MPFTPYASNRNYLNKLIAYDTLIDCVNSKTYLPDLCNFIQYILDNNIYTNNIGALNFVNTAPLCTKQVVDIIEEFGLIDSSKKQFVSTIESLNVKANRSNCVLENKKLTELYPDFTVRTEREALNHALTEMKALSNTK